MQQNCLEQLLSDVVRVDLVPASECKLPVPFQVAGLTEMTVADLAGWEPQKPTAALGQATLSLSYSVADGDDGEIDQAPTYKQTEKRQAAGHVVTHTIDIPVTAAFTATREAVALTQRSGDFHALLTTDAGQRYLLYALPNTPVVTLEEQGIDQQSTVKVTLQSMSHAILLK